MAWAHSPKVPPCMRVIESITRWLGARAAKAVETFTTTGSGSVASAGWSTGSVSVMHSSGVGGGVRPGKRSQRARGGRAEAVGDRALDVRGRRPEAAEFDPAGVAKRARPHGDLGPGRSGLSPDGDRAGQPAGDLGDGRAGYRGNRLADGAVGCERHGRSERPGRAGEALHVPAEGVEADDDLARH